MSDDESAIASRIGYSVLPSGRCRSRVGAGSGQEYRGPRSARVRVRFAFRCAARAEASASLRSARGVPRSSVRFGSPGPGPSRGGFRIVVRLFVSALVPRALRTSHGSRWRFGGRVTRAFKVLGSRNSGDLFIGSFFHFYHAFLPSRPVSTISRRIGCPYLSRAARPVRGSKWHCPHRV